MQIVDTALTGVKLVRPVKFKDDRGWFSETYRKDVLTNAGIAEDFVQDNQSFSVHAGTVRGIHFQLAPMGQAKLVRVLSGSILDVAVDLRASSPTFGRHVAVRLDADNGEQLYVPVGFGHAFCTLEPNTMVAYKVNAYYSREHDRNLAWNDPELGIVWPFSAEQVVLSDKDQKAPHLKDSGKLFD